jgi:hypothetical protein
LWRWCEVHVHLQGWSLELRVHIRKVGKLNAHLTPRWSARVEDKGAKLKPP